MGEFTGLFMGLSVAIFFGFLAWGVYAVSKPAPKWLKFLLAPLFLLFIVISAGTLWNLLGITYPSFQPNATQLVVTTSPSVTQPTSPPVPTFTRTPKPSTTPTAVRITGSYKGDIFLSINIMMDTVRQVDELFSNPQFDNPDWKYEVESLARRVQKIHKNLSEMQAPANMSDVHAALLDGTADCDQSMTLLIEGLYSTNHTELQQAIELLDSCGDKVAVRTKILAEKISE